MGKALTGGAASTQPRAFARGVGFLHQAVGGILFLTSCCLCSGYGVVAPPNTGDQAITSEVWTLRYLVDHPAASAGLLTTLAATVGGLGWMVFGFGLQSEHRRAAWGVLSVTLVMLLALGAAGGLLWVHGGSSWTVRGLHAGLTLLTLTSLILGFLAQRQVAADPPPDDLYAVRDEELAEDQREISGE